MFDSRFVFDFALAPPHDMKFRYAVRERQWHRVELAPCSDAASYSNHRRVHHCRVTSRRFSPKHDLVRVGVASFPKASQSYVTSRADAHCKQKYPLPISMNVRSAGPDLLIFCALVVMINTEHYATRRGKILKHYVLRPAEKQRHASSCTWRHCSAKARSGRTER